MAQEDLATPGRSAVRRDAITVIVPVYNAARHVRAALEALCAQSVRDWHAICVDDGSTDGSGAILDAFAARDGRFTVIHRANAGVSAARNAALERATGEMVAFLDADDAVAPDWLARLRSGLEGVDLAWGGMTVEQAGRRTYDGPSDVGTLYAGDAVRRRVWRAVFGYRLRDLVGLLLPGGPWRRCRRELGGVNCRAFRRDVLGGLRFDERLHLYEDALFLAAYAQRARTMRVIGDTGYRYLMRADGSMNTEIRARMVQHKFALRDARRALDPRMTHLRGTFLLSAFEILRRAGLSACFRYVTFRPLTSGRFFD